MRRLKSFYDIGQEYLIWINQYNSSTFTEPVYMIWYTDTDEAQTDRFLTYKSGDIIGFRVLAEVKKIIQHQSANLIFPDKLYNWLDAFESGTEEVDCIYDVRIIEDALVKEDLDPESLQVFVNFINVVRDLGNQEPENEHLLYYSDSDTIDLIWNYCYNTIFWPNAWKAEEDKVYVRPALEVDYSLLRQDFKEMQLEFEAYIQLT